MTQVPYPDHQLCGFLCTVLTPPPDFRPESKSLDFGTRCETFFDGNSFGFRSETGVVLTPIPGSQPGELDIGGGDCSGNGTPDGNREPERGGDEAITKTRMKKKERGMVMKKKGKLGAGHGSTSVVHQLHDLVTQKCVKIMARVVRVAVDEDAVEFRAVVSVDVYLPTQLRAGWQFPRSSSTAAALFGHLSCDWRKRKFFLDNVQESCENIYEDCRDIWKLGICHVLGCKRHCSSTDSSKRQLFDLHEVFNSLPSLVNEEKHVFSRIVPDSDDSSAGIWDLSDDILASILAALCPLDLVRVSAACRHLRGLSPSIMPCVKLKLFPHQQAAVEWMLRREQNADIMPHPLYSEFCMEDGFSFHMNLVSGKIITGMKPTINDFRGGMFCDEPGLGKTITALSLILKTQGTMADPPDGVQVVWCTQNCYEKCGYYECGDMHSMDTSASAEKQHRGPNDKRILFSLDELTPRKQSNERTPRKEKFVSDHSTCNAREATTSARPSARVLRLTESRSRMKRNLFGNFEEVSRHPEVETTAGRCRSKRKSSSSKHNTCLDNEDKSLSAQSSSRKKLRRDYDAEEFHNETWIQCDACQKWRRLSDGCLADSVDAWFCSMNPDPVYQTCTTPEEPWDRHSSITYYPGFCDDNFEGLSQNVSFFSSVLKEHYSLLDRQTRKALIWLARLSPEKLSEMGTRGLVRAGFSASGAFAFHKIFRAFGLVKKVEKDVVRWYYPPTVKNLVLDLAALRIALCEPLDSFRMYLSRATLIVVPSNLVEHWKSQIKKHVRSGQLRVYVWIDHRKPSTHSLAWDYDVVLTTISRLSAEWGTHKKSALRQVHWRRVILDEGHTLGSSLSMTNKLQMAISLVASSRWLLTGTPTPNTPNSQLSHLKPMLKFLHDEAYGLDKKSWEAGILKPFEAEMEEGRSRLLQLLNRCMISARKSDMRCIPPCIKKKTYLHFTEGHAQSYNELVVTVRRNILMADWNDPSHVESLLNPKQWKFRANTIRNVRLSCCVAGHIKVTDAGHDIQDTMDMLVQDGLDPVSEEYAIIRYSLMYGIHCQRCKLWCRLPIITPCRHLLCLDCVAVSSEKCTLPGCGNSYEMQSPEILTRPENPHPKWPVPKDLIELQPSYKQDNWDPDWQSTSSSKVSYVIQRLKDIAVSERPRCSMKDENSIGIGFASSSNDTVDNSYPQQETLSRASNDYCGFPVQKVLIFSQFLEHIHVIEQQLAIAGIKYVGMYSPMQIGHKMKSLATFQQDADCMVLVMDGTAALGLDLSFVSHVFLMEPIWDRSMEEQVISRAHRMGAVRPIHVETLAMLGTIEEQMLEFLENAVECRKLLKEEDGRDEGYGARARRSLHDFADRNYLARLGTVRTSSKLS